MIFPVTGAKAYDEEENSQPCNETASSMVQNENQGDGEFRLAGSVRSPVVPWNPNIWYKHLTRRNLPRRSLPACVHLLAPIPRFLIVMDIHIPTLRRGRRLRRGVWNMFECLHSVMERHCYHPFDLLVNEGPHLPPRAQYTCMPGNLGRCRCQLSSSSTYL